MNRKQPFSFRSFRTVTLLFGVILLCLTWGGLIFKVQEERQLELAATFKETANFAKTFAEHTSRTLRGLDEITRYLKHQAEEHSLALDLQRYVAEKRFEGQPFTFLAIVDETGELTASSAVVAKVVNFSDSDFFAAQRRLDSGLLFIGKPQVGQVSGQMELQLSRRINKPDGSFAGVAIVAIDPYYFTDFYRQLDLGPDSSVTLLGLDGILRARQSGDLARTGLDYNRSDLMRQLEETNAGTYSSPSFVDSVNRIRSFRVLPDYPLAVAVGVTEDYAFADLNQRIGAYTWLCAGVSGLILLFVGLLLRFDSRRSRDEAALQRSILVQTVLRQIADASITAASLDDFYRFVHNLTDQILPAKHFSIALLEASGDGWVIPFGAELTNFRALHRPLGKGLSEYTLRQGRTVHLDETALNRLRASGEYDLSFQKIPLVQFIGAPLLDRRGKPIGLIALALTDRSNSFLPEDAELLSIIAAQMAMAIDRKRTEETLRQSEELYRSTVAASPDGVLVTDLNGQVRMFSPRMKALLGLPPDFDPSGHTCFDLLAPESDSAARAWFQQIIDGQQLGPREYHGHRQDGSPIELEVQSDCTRDASSTVNGVVFSVRDIGERKRIEAEQRRSSAVQLVLARIAEAAMAAKDLDEFYPAVHRLIGQILPAQNFCIALLDDAAQRIRLPYRAAERDELPLERPVGRGLTEYLIRQGYAMHLGRADLSRLAAAGEIRDHMLPGSNYLCCPLKDSNEQSFGAMILYTHDLAVPFQAQDLDIFAIVATQVALGIERRRLEEALLRQAQTDKLTSLRNRQFLEQHAEWILEYADRYREALSLVIFDLDHFKRVNDTWGHLVGDEVLIQIARLASLSVRDTDLLIRLGGEEFLLLLPQTNAAGAAFVAEKIRAAAAKTAHPVAGAVTASFGVAERNRAESFRSWYRRADEAMYEAKQAGRNRVVCSDPDQFSLTTAHMDWRPEWDSGHPDIDSQHHELLDIACELAGAALRPQSSFQPVSAILERLFQHIPNHFACEEQILYEADYPHLKAHQTIHAKLARKAITFRDGFMQGEIKAGAFLSFLMDEVIVEHMLKEDAKFFPYLQPKQD